MSRFERTQNEPTDPPGGATGHAPAPVSDADESAAHIAELVRRTTDGQASPGSSPLSHPDATEARPTPVTAPQVATRIGGPDATKVAGPVAAQTEGPDATRGTPPEASRVTGPEASPAEGPVGRTSHPTRWQPTRRVLVIAGVLVGVLITGGVALSDPFGSGDAPPPAPPAALKTTAAAGYAVKVTDVITDCASHSRGRTQESFEAENCVKATRSLATGEVGGRPVLYVVSRIEMATGEAAASVKQVLDGNGTGNVDDLLRDGKTYPGAPGEMPSSGYASVQKGTVVTVAEAGFVDDGQSSSTDPALRSAAAEVAARGIAQG